jgi:hypothetical protein
MQEMYYVEQRVFICGTLAKYSSQEKITARFVKKILELTREQHSE